MNKIILLCLSIMVLFTKQIAASDYWDTKIEVNDISHDLLLCIPSNYNASNEYPLVIGLHYCGSSASVYRDALRKMSDSLNVIIACPDNFSSEILDKDISMLQITIDSVAAKYNIDQSQMYLTGMSCNGKVTLRHGLKKTINFKGIFPWVPWIGMYDLKSFDLHSDVPVTIAVGTADDNYQTILNLYDSLKNNGANVNLVLVKNIGHTLGFNSFADEMIRSLLYINDTNAIEISDIANFDMLNTEEKDIEMTVHHKGKKEVNIRLQVSNSSLMGEPAITNTNEDGLIKVSFKVKPASNKKGKAVFVLEAVEKNGIAIEQRTFKVNVKAAPTSIENKNGADLFFPNPASDFLKIHGRLKKVTYSIFDITGKVYLRENNFDTSGEINIQTLASGVYFITIENKEHTETFKLLVK